MDINLGLSASATGTVDVITATYSPAPTLVDKKILFLVASGANTSTTPTFSPNGLTAHTITKLGGSPLVAGDIAGANFVAILVYNLANTRWELLNPKFSFTPTLAQVLSEGASTGGIAVTSPDGKSTAEVIDGAITFTYRDGAINNYISIDPTQVVHSFSDGTDSGSTTINATEHNTTHSQLIQLNAPSVTKNGDEVATEPTVQSGSLLAGVASGADTYSVTLTPALSSYATTNVFFVKFTNANTGASTINFNTLGDIPIKKNATVALSSGDIIAGAIYRLAYDGTNFQIDLASVGVWQNWTPTLAGWTSATPTVAHSRYTLNGKMLTFSIFVAGQSSNATTASFTIPFNAAQTTRLTNGVATNSGAGQATPLRSDFVAGSNVVTIYKSPDASAWTAGGSLKGFNMTGTIEIQ